MLIEVHGLPEGAPFTRASRLKGTAFDGNNNPARRRVRVIRTSDMVVLATCVSDSATGAWALAGLPALTETDTVYVMAEDPAATEGADIASLLTYYQDEPA